MFNYEISKHAHFNAACRAFALVHNLEDAAIAVGMRPQILCNNLNPVQPYHLPVPMAGNDSGMFQFPSEGTLVEITFTSGSTWSYVTFNFDWIYVK